jgi:hypothetical protein
LNYGNLPIIDIHDYWKFSAFAFSVVRAAIPLSLHPGTSPQSSEHATSAPTAPIPATPILIMPFIGKSYSGHVSRRQVRSISGPASAKVAATTMVAAAIMHFLISSSLCSPQDTFLLSWYNWYTT